MEQGRVLDDQRVGLGDRLTRADLAVVDAAERHHRRAGPLRPEARESLRVPAFQEGGDGQQLRARDNSLAAAAVQPPATHTIAIEGVSYAPQSLTVHVGDRIVWVNKDPFPHTATSQGSGVDSKEIAGNGGSWTYTAARAGDFNYICTLHPTMTGTLTVE